LSFAREVADRVVFLRGGVIVEEGTPLEIFDDPQRPDTIEFLARVRA
jgi:polar amino acid transport system ATP-binding protein